MKILSFLTLIILIAFQVNSQTKLGVDEINGLKVGDTAPSFSAVNAHDTLVTSESLLAKGPMVVIFYRGEWCPFCNKHLSQIQDSLQQIIDLGASVVTISPEKPEYAEKTIEKTGATFTLLYDEGYKIASSFDVLFKPKSLEIFKYNTFVGAELKDAHSGDDQNLPVPATFIINKEGIVLWRHFDPNYKERSSVSDIIKVISGL